MGLVAVLGGSFDPVHLGHVALARHFVSLLEPAGLRIIPAGNPWQKAPLGATAEQRIAMLERAFGGMTAAGARVALQIDRQEIARQTASYSVDTLRALRAELGAETPIAFLMGADQLQNLHTWRDWEALFGLAHICAASRPGYALDGMAPAVAEEFAQRAMTAADIRQRPAGGALLAPGLAQDMSATAIRAALKDGKDSKAARLLPAAVLDYIQQHHLYQD